MRISGYRLMWLQVMFDLPVMTKEDRREYRRFVDRLEDDGFSRVQYSVYVRPCATEENTAVHTERVVGWLPPGGEVRVLRFTDKQWARMLVFRESRRVDVEEPPEQFSFFDSALEPLFGEPVDDDVDHRLQVAATEQEQKPEEADRPDVVKAFLRAAERANRKYGGRGRRPPKNDSGQFEFFD